MDQRFAFGLESDLTWEEGGVAEPGLMKGDMRLNIWCEQVPPFHLMPRALLKAVVEGVVQTTASFVLQLFVRRLASDYVRCVD